MSGAAASASRRRSAPTALRRLWTATLAAVLLLPGALLLPAATLWRQPAAVFGPEFLPVKRVQVTGNFLHLSPAELEERAARAVRGGFFTVSVADVARALLRDAWIADVVVKRAWPDGLVIHITEHEPVAAWGERSLLSAGREIFSPPPSSRPAGLPRLTGPEGSHQAVWEQYQLLRSELAPRGLAVARLALTERKAWRFQLEDGPVVMLGRKSTALRLQRFFRLALPRHAEQLARAVSIDMRYTNGFAIKWAATPQETT